MTKETDSKQPNKIKHFCKFCKKTITGGSYKFNAHLYLHNAVKPRFRCKYCMKDYYRRDMYLRHLTTHERFKKTRKNIFICDYCDREYVDKRNLISHLRIHDDTITSNLIRFTCKVCGTNYCEKRILLNHIRRVHFNPIDTQEPLHVGRRVNESWYETVIQTDVCVEMTKINNNIISIKKFGRIKNSNKLTDDKFNNTPLVKRNCDGKTNINLRTDDYTLYSKAVCDYCNKEMLKKSIQNHIRERHLNIRNFKCSECERCFHRRYQWADHTCKGSKMLSRSKRVTKTSE